MSWNFCKTFWTYACAWKNVALCGVCQTFLRISYNKVCHLEEQNTPCCECLDSGSHCYCQYAIQYNAHFACTRKSTPTHLVWLQRYQWYRRYRTKNETKKHSIKFWNHHCDLDLEHSNPIFSQDTLAYDGVPVTGGRRISSAEDRKSYFGYTSPNCDLEDSNPMFSRNSPAYSNSTLYWLQKALQFRRELLLKSCFFKLISTFKVTLTLNPTI